MPSSRGGKRRQDKPPVEFAAPRQQTNFPFTVTIVVVPLCKVVPSTGFFVGRDMAQYSRQNF
jgi:hypothetical protein